MIEISPYAVLDGAGIKDYFIDFEEKTIYLSEGELQKVVAFFDEKLYQGVSAIDRCGWLYKSPDSLRLNEDSFLI